MIKKKLHQANRILDKFATKIARHDHCRQSYVIKYPNTDFHNTFRVMKCDAIFSSSPYPAQHSLLVGAPVETSLYNIIIITEGAFFKSVFNFVRSRSLYFWERLVVTNYICYRCRYVCVRVRINI